MAYHDPTFKEWVLNFIDTDTNLGDLAIDIKKDHSFPDTADKGTMMAYIKNRTRNEVVHNTLSAAVDLYNTASGAHDSFSHRAPYQQ